MYKLKGTCQRGVHHSPGSCESSAAGDDITLVGQQHGAGALGAATLLAESEISAEVSIRVPPGRSTRKH